MTKQPWHINLLRTMIGVLLRLFFRIKINGLENLKNSSSPRVIIANHVSFLDGPILATSIPGDLSFAVSTFSARRWWFKPWLYLVPSYCVDTLKPHVTNAMIKDIQDGRTLVLFPEGRLSVTGTIMKIYEGFSIVVEKTNAELLPIHIDGTQYYFFARLKGVFRRRLFPQITVTIGPSRKMPEIPNKTEKRKMAVDWLHTVMSEMGFQSAKLNHTLFDAFLLACKSNGKQRKILCDILWTYTAYHQLLTRATVLGRYLVNHTQEREQIGLLLPNMAITVSVFMGLQAIGRVPTMLNYTMGPLLLKSACRTARVKLILTSEKFIQNAELQNEITALSEECQILYLESLKDAISLYDKLAGWFISTFRAKSWSRKYQGSVDDPAVILFTSGSEGTPKGVALSHRNLLANVEQLKIRIDVELRDRIFNTLPLFHSFGLTCGMIMPLLRGIPIFLYISPLHYKTIPGMVYSSDSTILFAADTFLGHYGRHADAYDFRALRYVFAGAEALRPATRNFWLENFGIRILEGYGVTEAAPVISVNVPMHNRNGTIGRLLPGIEIFLEPIEGIEEGGCLWVKGKNVMLGYIRDTDPGVIQPLEGGWHNTGDVVVIDADGYLKIIDRVKRFAKIAGEMVSLTMVESTIAQAWPEAHHAVIAQPDPAKGESLILVTTYPDPDRRSLVSYFKEKGLSELYVPRQIIPYETIPLLSTGKVNYPLLKSEVVSV